MRSSVFVLVALALLGTSCSKDNPLQPLSRVTGSGARQPGSDLARPAPLPTLVTPAVAASAAGGAPLRDSQIVHVPFFIQDAGGGTPTDPSTPLFESRDHNPILAPDGHQVTLAEFNAVEGTAAIKCVAQGTHIALTLSHLIPNGVYSIKLLTFKSPGFDGTFANLIGLGALGPSDGSRSAFRASASGQGAISATTPGGPLSVFGTIADCALTGEFEFHVVGVYHIDGKTYGGNEAPAGTAVEQFAFIIHS